jgi:hypothetical protein
MIDPKVIMIEFYGSTVRFGVEGKWVAWVPFTELFEDGHKPTRKEMRAIVEEQDRLRTS